MNQKDISTWTTTDIISWLKNINMTQYISKFESNKINGYDLIYLTKEDLKNLGVINIHDKNIILNSMKEALLQQLKLKVNYNNKFINIQLDFDPNYTVEELVKALKLIFKSDSELFLIVNNNDILMPNLKIIDLILYEPQVYKNFKIVSDNQLFNTDLKPNDYNAIYMDKESNNKEYISLLNNHHNSNRVQPGIKTPNKNIYKNYYSNNNIDSIMNKTVGNQKYSKGISSFDNNYENLYNKKYPNKKIIKNFNNSSNINTNIINNYNNITNEEFISNYKTYNDYNNINKLRNNDNININNNLYEYNNNYSINNGKQFKNNLNSNELKKQEEDEGQKYSSEKRNYRLKELDNINYGENDYKYNYNLMSNNNDMKFINDNRMNYTGGFNDRMKNNSNNNINLNFKK